MMSSLWINFLPILKWHIFTKHLDPLGNDALCVGCCSMSFAQNNEKNKNLFDQLGMKSWTDTITSILILFPPKPFLRISNPTWRHHFISDFDAKTVLLLLFSFLGWILSRCLDGERHSLKTLSKTTFVLLWYQRLPMGVPLDEGKSHLTSDAPWWIKPSVCSFQVGLWGCSPKNGSWKDYLRAVLNNRVYFSLEGLPAPSGLTDICTTSLVVDTKESAAETGREEKTAGNVNASPPCLPGGDLRHAFRCSVFVECNYTTWHSRRRMWDPWRQSIAGGVVLELKVRVAQHWELNTFKWSKLCFFVCEICLNKR